MSATDPQPAKMSTDEFKLRLQLETSLLVWMRTSIGLMGFGFVLARFGLFLREVAAAGQTKLESHPHLSTMSTFSGTAIMLLGVVVMILSVLNHRRFVGQVERGDFHLPLRWSLGVILSLVMAVFGVVMAIFLAVIER
jgi:putative membrane protein